MSARGTLRGALAGLCAALAAAAAMYVAGGVAGTRALPDLLQQPFLAILPGPVFGFLIDNLQHLGKVLEEAGLLAVMVAALTGLGAVAGALVERRSLPRAGLLAGLVAWLVTALALLPLAGAGLLGLGDGVATPVVWALVYAVYALVWEAGWTQPALDAPADPGRRRALGLLPSVIGLGSLLVVGFVKVPGWVLDVVSPPESGLGGAVPAITPLADFYRVSKNFQDPTVAAAGWALRVGGLAERPLRLGHDELRGLPATTAAVTLECISNDVGGPLMSTGRFTGVPLRDLLAMAGPRPGAAAVNFRARDGYTESLPLALVMGEPEILVAYALDGAPLPDLHGFPARVLIPGRYGMKGPKWLDEIDLAAAEGGGFWEQQGWDAQAVVRTTARIDSPRDGQVVRLGPAALAGVAFAGTRGVEAVEWSQDGGRTWAAAELTEPLSRLTWVLWRAPWTPAREGVHTLTVRARDGTGDLQPASQAPSYPSGAQGLHSIRVTVGR